MKLDTGLSTRNLSDVPAAARAAEEAGFDAIWTAEAGNDGFIPAALIAEHTKKIKMGPAVAIAFPRSPMVTAYSAWDLAGLSGGRFILGLGTQVKGHIERRFSTKWEAPVPRLREYIQSLRAIFKSFAACSRLTLAQVMRSSPAAATISPALPPVQPSNCATRERSGCAPCASSNSWNCTGSYQNADERPE